MSGWGKHGLINEWDAKYWVFIGELFQSTLLSGNSSCVKDAIFYPTPVISLGIVSE